MKRAAELREHRLDFRVRASHLAPRTSHLAHRCRVIGRRRDAEPHVRHVLLLVRDEELRQPRRVADEDDEQARRQGVERPGVADARDLQRTADERNDVVRGRAGRLVDEQRTVHKKGPQSAVYGLRSTVNR
jgi:hypothetical protein